MPGRTFQLTGLAPVSRADCRGYMPVGAMPYLNPDSAAQPTRATMLNDAEVPAMRMSPKR